MSENWRPNSLAEVARRVLAGEQAFDPALREFLDQFYAKAETRGRAIKEEPLRVGFLEDAYLAAVAEHLALSHGLGIPNWVEGAHRRLARPYFAGGLESTKALLLVESPLAFRRRNLFVSANALARARQFANEPAS